MSLQGNVLHQNKSSVAYMGKITAEAATAAAAAATGGIVATAADISNSTDGIVSGSSKLHANAAVTGEMSVSRGDGDERFDGTSSTFTGLRGLIDAAIADGGVGGSGTYGKRRRDPMLLELFKLDLERLDDMLEEVLEGKIWKGESVCLADCALLVERYLLPARYGSETIMHRHRHCSLATASACRLIPVQTVQVNACVSSAIAWDCRVCLPHLKLTQSVIINHASSL